MRDAFSDCHPIVNFIFYLGALVMGMRYLHPAFLGCSLLLSATYYAMVKKRCGAYLGSMALVFLGVAGINPFFNTHGATTLFTYLGDRPYTLEALYYGMAVGAMFVTILTWFGSYNRVMTGDKFLYCFGKLAPAASLILTMVLRLVPSFQKKADMIGGARKCIGKSVENGSTYERAEHGLTLVSALTSWALEGGVVMADSMRSRGFGTGKRTAFSIYRLRQSDRWLLGLMVVLLSLMILCEVKGGMEVTYVPELHISWIDSIWTKIGVVCYGGFLFIPTGMHMWEEIRWHILKSRI